MALNKGEWSEVYTFLKLLADGKLYAADANLNKIDSIYYPILKIIREEPSGDLEFAHNSKIEVFSIDGVKQLELTVDEFKQKSIELLDGIKNSSGSSFDIPNILDFMHSIKITRLTAGSRVKRDITIVVHDIFTGHEPTLGFSIKSRLGNPSTLINAGGSTNFIYELDTVLSTNDINTINAISTRSKIRDRIDAIKAHGSNLVYADMQSQNFKQNLTMIDSLFPLVIAEMLKIYFTGQPIKVSEIVETLNTLNPCNYDQSNQHPYYEYKVKKFLTDSALGMTSGVTWTGKFDANGGYIVVKEDGEIVCYHIYNHNEFEEYLYTNTRLETASSSRHGFGVIYEENGKQFFKLNLQVRFL